MLRLAIVAFLLALLTIRADTKFEECKSGPFVVITNGPDRPPRDLLVRLEQIRHVLSTLTGKPDIEPTWPMTVLMVKSAPRLLGWELGRDAYVAIIPVGVQPDRQWLRDTARILMESSLRRMPAKWENGLLDLLSTLETDGPKITLGTPPPPAEQTRDWARMHYLATNPEYTTRFRVLLSNLQQGAEEVTAYRNSLGLTPAEVEKAVDAYLSSKHFAPLLFSGRAIQFRDFPTYEADTPLVNAALADRTGDASLMPSGSLQAAEFLGLKGGAEWLQQAVAGGSKSARVHLAYGLSLKEPEAKRAAYVEAAKKNPKWAQPYIELANLETTAARQAFYLKTAANLDSRNSALWQRLANAQDEGKEYSEAAKSWFAAELAAGATERDKVRAARQRFQEQRAEKEAAERRRIAEEKERDLDRLKTEALNRVREAEARANKGQSPLDSSVKVVEWWDDGQPSQRLAGALEKIDCLGKQARAWIRVDGKLTALLIRDPGQIVVMGNGDASLGCGPQKPPRNVQVEYKQRQDAKLLTAGDVVLIEFR